MQINYYPLANGVVNYSFLSGQIGLQYRVWPKLTINYEEVLQYELPLFPKEDKFPEADKPTRHMFESGGIDGGRLK